VIDCPEWQARELHQYLGMVKKTKPREREEGHQKWKCATMVLHLNAQQTSRQLVVLAVLFFGAAIC
jgi:hypothetical protein